MWGVWERGEGVLMAKPKRPGVVAGVSGASLYLLVGGDEEQVHLLLAHLSRAALRVPGRESGLRWDDLLTRSTRMMGAGACSAQWAGCVLA